jgi:general secretion pathway protein D
MKKLLVSLSLLPGLAFASPVSFDFKDVSLVTFSQATFKDIMKRDFVISPDVLSADRKISISLKSIDTAAVPAFVEDLLGRQGIEVTQSGGIYFLAKKGAQDVQAPSQAAQTSGPSTSSPQIVQAPVRAPDPVPAPPREEDSEVYVPQNRPADFMMAVGRTLFSDRSFSQVGNTIVLTGSKKQLLKMRALVTSLDTLPASVDVSAAWIEVTRTEGQSRGISLAANVLGAKLGISLGTISDSAIALSGTKFQLAIEALNTDGRFKQISNSRVLGDDRERMTLIVGDETPTVAQSGSDNSGNSVQSITYRPSGVIVDVLPKVLGSGKINLTIDGQISNFKATTTGVTNSPTLIKRQVKTAVTVADGDVLLIGGLNDTQQNEHDSRFAFLPGIGAKQRQEVKTDLVLLLSARVPTPQ